MKEVKLTPEQRDAVERLGQDVCVVAGPGSGKTGVLVERFAWLASARSIPPAEILTITFTEKAAQEIKSRLAERFANSELKSEVQRAPVSTIHSFCARLLREHAVRAHLDPKYEVLDERQARILQHEAMTQVLDEFAAARREDFRFLASVWSSSDPAIDLLSVYDTLRTDLWSGEIAIAAPADVKPLLRRMLDEAHRALQAPATTDAAQRRADALRTFVAAGANPPDPIAWAYSLDVKLSGLRAGHPVHDAVTAMRGLQPEILDAYAAPARNMVRELLLQFDKLYREQKRERAALDFSDLEEHSISLLKSDPSVRRAAQASYRHILMDELQDTNPAQWQIVKLIHTADNFFAVGDINQSIYGFRSADPGLFAKYEQSLNEAKKNIDRLQDNYRSRPPILAAASAFAKSAPGITPHELIAKGEFKEKKEDACVEVIRVEGDSEAELESRHIARRIRELVSKQKVKFEEIAILARTAAPFAELETALYNFSVPCVVVKRGKNFYKEPEIVDLTNWLRVLADPEDKIAQFALLRSPFYGFSDEDLLRRKLAGQMVPAEIAAQWDALRALREDTPPDLILSRVIDDCGYETILNPRARANIDKFLDLLREWHKSEPGDYSGWIADLDDVRENEKEPNAPSAETGDAVQLMSIHAAKGLQFKVVFIAGLNRTSRTSKEPVCWSRETGLGLRWRNPVTGGDGVDDPATTAFKASEKEREEREADRLLYVAMTRAKEHLVLSWRESKRTFVWPAQVEERLGINWDGVPDMTPVVNERGIRLYRTTQAPPSDLPATAASMTPPPALLPRLGAQHGPAPSYTITAIADFAACPRHYWLARDLHWPLQELADDDNSGASLGTQVHEILARGAAQPGDPPAALRLAERFWNSELGRRAARATRVEREYPFVFAHKDAIFSGKIDLFFIENGESVLVDYKTGKAGHRLRSYELQLRLYALGAPSAPTKAYLCLLTEDRVHEVDLSVRGEGWIEEFLRAQDEYEFPLNEGAHCAQCEFWHRACPSAIGAGSTAAS